MSPEIGPNRHPVATPVVVYDGEVPDSGRDRAFVPAFHTFWWVREGWAEIAGEFGRVRIRAGRGIFLSPQIHRHQTFAPSTRMLSLSFVLSWNDGLPLLDSRPPVRLNSANASDLIPRAEAVCGANENAHLSPERWMAFQAAFQTFLAVVLHWTTKRGFRILESARCDARLVRVAEDIRRQPAAGPLPFERWERLAGIGRAQINRLARIQFGESLHAYRNRILAGALRKELLSGKVSTKELAAAFGFVDSAHLCHWLRRQTGCSPAELRHQGA